MMRWLVTLGAVGAVASAFAQASFTISRPADGARVREKVRVQIPKGSIPPGGYIGVFLNDRFLEAVVPPLEGRFHVYTLDTKARNIPDGRVNLRVKLFVDFQDAPKKVDESSVNLTVANQANIPIPANGIRLRYRFNPGWEQRYTLTQRITTSSITEGQNSLGGRAAEQDVDTQVIRWLFSVDNAYGNGDGLMRIQPLPQRGRDYAIFTRLGETTPNQVFEDQMTPVYMRLTPTGNEVFGTIPPFIPVEGITGGNSPVNWFGVYPLPTLPDAPVRPGSTWAARFLLGRIDEADRLNLNTLVRRVPARGEFVGVEWEMGFPCAKIKHTISEGRVSLDGRNLQQQGREFTDDKITLEETVWFALDRRQIVRIERSITIDQRAQAAQGGMFGGMPGGTPPPATGGAGGRGRDGDEDFFQQGRGGRGFPSGPPPGMGGPPPGMFGPGGPGGMRPGGFNQGPNFGGGNQFGRGAGGQAPQAQFIRLRVNQSFLLER